MDYLTKLNSLTVFRSLLNDKVISDFKKLLTADKKDKNAVIDTYCTFTASLFHHTVNLSRYILNTVLENENFYMLKACKGKKIDEELDRCLICELKILEEISLITPEDIINDYDGYLPRWQTEKLDFVSTYKERIENIHAHGYGIFAKYYTFIVENGELIPVKSPDAISLSNLSGYESQREELIDNTKALLRGLPAANALLYGDAGTGKSTSVKAVANEFKNEGLRLIELKKNQLHEIPKLVDYLSVNPLKFIVFIDDLSFTKDDDDFAALKAMLEGSVSSKANNLVIYATSNRRHLVKEKFSDRDGDEIHVNDTREELISLSDRFGLTITFIKPGKNAYLDIVKDLALQYNLKTDIKDVEAAAERFALRKGGRSPRVAKQCIEQLKSMEG